MWQVGARNGRGKCGAPRGGRAHHLLLVLLLRCHLRRRLLLLFHHGSKVLLAVLLRKHHGEGKEKRNQREEPNPAEHGNAVCVRSGVRACARSGPGWGPACPKGRVCLRTAQMRYQPPPEQNKTLAVCSSLFGGFLFAAGWWIFVDGFK